MIDYCVAIFHNSDWCWKRQKNPYFTKRCSHGLLSINWPFKTHFGFKFKVHSAMEFCLHILACLAPSLLIVIDQAIWNIGITGYGQSVIMTIHNNQSFIIILSVKPWNIFTLRRTHTKLDSRLLNIWRKSEWVGENNGKIKWKPIENWMCNEQFRLKWKASTLRKSIINWISSCVRFACAHPFTIYWIIHSSFWVWVLNRRLLLFQLRNTQQKNS